MRKPALKCQDMSELRLQIDQIDREIIETFAERLTYITRAAELKQDNGLPARIEERVEEVVGNVKTHAGELGLNADLFEAFWRQLVDQAIEHEESFLGKDSLRKPSSS
ncbi:chorismate mutase [Polycladidibacter stylochi]|uniref:chorismate mutase n=1 Tax=Polycladidibacter stylochi TaxID=1807766 RepID=UPI00082EFFDA|nr:chorismate mutase [Pseudovibrio stylochi]